MLRLLVALGSLLTTAGITGVLMDAPSTGVPLAGPARHTPDMPTAVNVTPAMTTTASCAILVAPTPADFHREAVGTLDATQSSFDVAFPVERTDLVDHVVIRFATEWGGPAARHSVRLEDALHRTIRDEEGKTLALTSAPVAGKYVARLTGSGIVGVESVRATIDVHYAAPAPSTARPWTAHAGAAPVEWAFMTDALPVAGDARVPLQVEHARPLDLKVWLLDDAFTNADVRVVDELGNALHEQRVQGLAPSGGPVLTWSLADGRDAARTVLIHDDGGSVPGRFLVALTVLPDPPALTYGCAAAAPPQPYAMDG